LTRLNNVELALESMARVDKHLFMFYYGGAHKSMRRWRHTTNLLVYENDVENIAGALKQIEAFGGGKMVACILQGLFTSHQLLKVKEQFICPAYYILTAMYCCG
jgi:hypothetical protein